MSETNDYNQSLAPIEGFPMAAIVDTETGKVIHKGWYAYHERRQLSPIGDELREDDVDQVVFIDTFADWNMPRTMVAKKVTLPGHRIVPVWPDRNPLFKVADALGVNCADRTYERIAERCIEQIQELPGEEEYCIDGYDDALGMFELFTQCGETIWHSTATPCFCTACGKRLVRNDNMEA